MTEITEQDVWLSAKFNHLMADFRLEQTDAKLKSIKTGVRRLAMPWVHGRGSWDRRYRRIKFKSFGALFTATRVMRKHGIMPEPDRPSHHAVIRWREEHLKWQTTQATADIKRTT